MPQTLSHSAAIARIEPMVDAVPASSDAFAPIAYLAEQILDGKRSEADMAYMVETARIHARPFLAVA
jgi:hypothetical protein